MTTSSVFYSNRTEILFQQLKEKLFSRDSCLSNSSAFTRRLIIVSNPLMKSWLMWQLANDPDLGIAFGFEICFLHQATERIEDLLNPNKQLEHIPSSLELTLRIEKELREVIQNWSYLSKNDQEIWLPVLKFLKTNDQKLTIHSKKNENQLTTLSEMLSRLFLQYGVYGGKLVSSWETASSSTGWQQQLWCRLFSGKTVLSYPYRKMLNFQEQPLKPHSNLHIHLFALGTISALHYRFLSHTATAVPVNYYLLSPCQRFWSDIKSDREAQSLKKYWEFKGASSSQLMDLEEYLRDRNPLLANFGRIGREAISQMEQTDILTEGKYSLKSSVKDHQQYLPLIDDEILWEEKNEPLTLLEAVQADMALLRNPVDDDKIIFSHYDQTIQMHAACSALREIEILYDNLLRIIDKGNCLDTSPLYQSEIIVMAPDIMKYESAIRAIFGKKESSFDYQIYDLQTKSNSSLIQGFSYLLTLASSRWDVASFMELLEVPEFQRCNQLKKEEISQIRQWIQQTDIRWGEDGDHRNELLKQDYCQKEMVEVSDVGTWEYGFQRLLHGLFMKLEEKDIEQLALEDRILPERSINTGQSSLLGKWIQIIRSLREDLKPLHEGIQLSLKDWSSYLNCICDAYFSVDLSDKNGCIALQSLKDVFHELSDATKVVGDVLYPWTSIKRQIDLALQKNNINYSENRLDAIRFCSLLPMRTIPAQVVALLGMAEDSFPKPNPKNPLNLMQNEREVDYCPSPTDYDRYLFLEALLSAKRSFLLSYSSDSSSDANGPSLLVNELLDYLDGSYSIQGEKISSYCMSTHPFYSFDKCYFSDTDHSIKSYCQDSYSAARSYYQQESYSSFPLFSIHTNDSLPCEDQVIHVKHLVEAVRNPVKLYVNQKLGIYLQPSEKKQLKSDETFSLSFLDLYLLKKSGLSTSGQQMVQIAEKQGKLPSGMFKEVASAQIQQEIEEWQTTLKNMEIDPKELFKIELNPHCKEAIQDSMGNWMVPALEVKVTETVSVKIVGSLQDVSAKGILFFGGDGPSDLFKTWPFRLIFQAILENTHHSFLKEIPLKILFAKTKKVESFAIDNLQLWLKRYLEYFFLCLKMPSPLLPEWLPTFIQFDCKTWEKIAQKSISQVFMQGSNGYLTWLMGDRQSIQMDEPLFNAWKEKALQVFPTDLSSTILKG